MPAAYNSVLITPPLLAAGGKFMAAIMSITAKIGSAPTAE